MTNGIIGAGGFIAWFYAVIYKRIRKTCRNIFFKIFIHIMGLLIMIIGFYFFVKTMPSFTSIAGLFLILFGLVVFLLPFGAE